MNPSLNPNLIKSILGSVPPWALLGLGFVTGWLKSFWDFFYSHTVGFLNKKISISITIEESDYKEAFVWINLWMEKHLRRKKLTHLRLDCKSRIGDSEDIQLIPSYGTYYIWWNKKFLEFNSTKKDTPVSGKYGSVSPLSRTLSITVWGTRNRQIILDLIKEARNEFEEVHEAKLKYYTHSGDWWDDHSITERKMESIYLPDSFLKDITADFQDFFNSKDKYRNLGVPYRRGYLLEGPPGSGKSSLVQALSCAFKVPIYYLNIHTKMEYKELQTLMQNILDKAIVLIEDVDSVQAANERDEKEEGVLKTSELLNALDGLVATEQRIVIMTSNHPKKLDKALLRAGRVDRVFHIGYAKEEELKKFYRKASEYYSLPSFEEFRTKLPENCTIADAQGEVFKPSLDSLE